MAVLRYKVAAARQIVVSQENYGYHPPEMIIPQTRTTIDVTVAIVKLLSTESVVSILLQ